MSALKFIWYVLSVPTPMNILVLATAGIGLGMSLAIITSFF